MSILMIHLNQYFGLIKRFHSSTQITIIINKEQREYKSNYFEIILITTYNIRICVLAASA